MLDGDGLVHLGSLCAARFLPRSFVTVLRWFGRKRQADLQRPAELPPGRDHSRLTEFTGRGLNAADRYAACLRQGALRRPSNTGSGIDEAGDPTGN